MCNVSNISVYKDGNDVYIRIRNCEASVEKVLLGMVNGAISGNTNDNISSVKNVTDKPVKEEEAKVEHTEAKFTFGPYENMTPKEIHLKLGAKKAFCYFMSLGKIYYKQLYDDVLVYIKWHRGFLNKRLQVETPSFDDKMVFFTEYRSLFSDKLDNYFKEKGYNTISDFLNCECEADSTAMYREYIKSLM